MEHSKSILSQDEILKKFKGEAKLNENRFGDVSLKKYIESERYENSIIEVDDIISMIEDRKRINMCVDFGINFRL